MKDGDIVFIESNSERAPAIKKLTGSDLTHCGIVFRDNHQKWIVFEGAGQIGSYSELAAWIARESGNGKRNSVYVRRLTDTNGRLSSKIEALKKRARELHDTHYDLGFAWGNKDADGKEYIYCSELVWKAFKETVGVELKRPHPLGDYIEHPPAGRTSRDVENDFEFYLNNPKSTERRNGQPYQRNELAISPREVFESGELEAVIDASH